MECCGPCESVPEGKQTKVLVCGGSEDVNRVWRKFSGSLQFLEAFCDCCTADEHPGVDSRRGEEAGRPYRLLCLFPGGGGGSRLRELAEEAKGINKMQKRNDGSCPLISKQWVVNWDVCANGLNN